MRKKFMTFVAGAALALTMAACGTAQTNSTVPTVEPTKEAEATITPTVAATSTVEPTATSTPVPTETPEPTATSTPVPTETPEPTATLIPTEAPEPTATPVPTEAPEPIATLIPTEAPKPTVTPVPTEAPKPTETPVADTKDWKTVLKKLHSLETYEEREAYVATLDTSRYKVAEEASFDLITRSNGMYLDIIETYDMKTGNYTTEIAPDSRIHYPSFSEQVLSWCADIPEVVNYDRTIGASVGERPTGENYLMTITNLATGETDPWGVKIHKAGAIVENVETDGFASFISVGIDPDSPVTVVYRTVEELVNEKNNMYAEDYYYDKCITYVEPVRPEERYDDNWNPTGEYFFYETSEEIVYVKQEDMQYDEWGDCYYCYDETGCYQNVLQDETGAYYYIFKKEYEVPIKDRGYTVAESEEFGSYLLDKNGAVVTRAYEITDGYSDPGITTWDTLKYYQDVYDPRFWGDFAQTYSYGGEYAIADMKAEDYPHLSADEFDSLKKRYMDVFDITLDEEVLAIRAEVMEEWGWNYKNYYDKAGVFHVSEGDAYVTITIDRPENWYFHNSVEAMLVVKDESIRKGFPAHEVMYYGTYQDVGTTAAETKEAAEKYFAQYARNAKKEDVASMEVNGRQVFYVETSVFSDARSYCVLQDIGLSRFVWIEITLTYDLETEAEKLIRQFLLDDNYTITQE